MVNVKTYPVNTPGAYVNTSGITAADVLVVDRNGIGVKHSASFNTGTNTEDIIEYQWYGVRPATRPSGTYLLEMSEVLTSVDRTYIYRVGPSPAVGFVFTVYSGTKIAKYRVQSGDTTQNVRDGLQAAIDALSWGFSVTTTAVGVNSIEVVVGDTTNELTNLVGQEKYKNGYYTIIGGVTFIVFEQESTTSQPALPAVAASYNYTALKPTPSLITTYLLEPLYIINYDEGTATPANINGVPIIGNVPANECVVYDFGQKIYFHLPLVAGEIINVISK